MKIQIDNDIAAILPALSPEAEATLEGKLLREKMRETLPYAVINGVAVQLGGHTRKRLCLKHNIPFDWHLVESVTTKQEAIAWVKQDQIGRRNLDSESLARLREGRRERVGEARAEGESIRTIAERENVSPATVHRDLETSGVSPRTPDEKPSGVHPRTPDQANGKVKGKDGKEYTASKPKSTTKRRKREGFDFTDWRRNLNAVLRGIDELNAMFDDVKTPLAEKNQRRLGEQRTALGKMLDVVQEIGGKLRGKP